MKPKIKEVIVVEGKSDTKKIQQAVDADTIETQGLALMDETLELIQHAQETRGVIVLQIRITQAKRFANGLQLKYRM